MFHYHTSNLHDTDVEGSHVDRIGSSPSSGPCRSARALDVLLTGFRQQLGQAETHQELQAVSAWFRSWTQKSGICLVQDVQDVHVLWMKMGIIFPIMAAKFCQNIANQS